MPFVDEVTGNFLQSWWGMGITFLEDNPKSSVFIFKALCELILPRNLKAIFCWFLKMKVTYFLSFSVTAIVLENIKFSKNGIFTLAQCFRCNALHLSGRGHAQLCNDPSSSRMAWASCCQSLARTQHVSHSPWHHKASHVQEFLAYSFSSGSSVSSFVSSGPGEVQEGPEDMILSVSLSSKRSAGGWHPHWVCFLLLTFSHVYRSSE